MALVEAKREELLEEMEVVDARDLMASDISKWGRIAEKVNAITSGEIVREGPASEVPMGARRMDDIIAAGELPSRTTCGSVNAYKPRWWDGLWRYINPRSHGDGFKYCRCPSLRRWCLYSAVMSSGCSANVLYYRNHHFWPAKPTTTLRCLNEYKLNEIIIVQYMFFLRQQCNDSSLAALCRSERI